MELVGLRALANIIGRHGHARLVVIGSVVVCAGWLSAAPQAPPDTEALMRRVGERVAEYQRRAQSVICVEESTVQPIQSDWALDGFSRTVESELRVESEAANGDTLPDARVIRDIRRINGRAPRERDKKDRTGCTDPSLLSPEPLGFLLPAHRHEYRFTSLPSSKGKNRAELIIDFISTNRTSRPELIEDERGHADCFDWSGPLATRGRVWVDANTHEVLRVDRRIDGPVDVRVPWRLQRRYNLAPWVVIERDDQTMRYKPVAFRDPEEVMLLPDSIESLTMLRGGLQSIRRTETFGSCRRFLTGARIVKDP
jgi:hypothetical protein